jgi:hypothetical protein
MFGLAVRGLILRLATRWSQPSGLSMSGQATDEPSCGKKSGARTAGHEDHAKAGFLKNNGPSERMVSVASDLPLAAKATTRSTIDLRVFGSFTDMNARRK